MPVLKDFRHTKEITLPGYAESKVVIFHSLLAGDSDLIVELQRDLKPSKIILILPKLIKEWNFTDENGAVLPITPENVNLLDDKDLKFMIEQVQEFAESIKKK
jgi:hypothetical protein